MIMMQSNRKWHIFRVCTRKWHERQLIILQQSNRKNSCKLQERYFYSCIILKRVVFPMKCIPHQVPWNELHRTFACTLWFVVVHNGDQLFYSIIHDEIRGRFCRHFLSSRLCSFLFCSLDLICQ